MAANDGDERVIATAQRIVKALGKNENMTEDMLRILSNFDDRFTNMNRDPASPAVSSAMKKVQESLDFAEDMVMRWDMSSSQAARHSMIWESQPEEAAFYLQAVDELQSLMGALAVPWGDRTVIDRAQNFLQLAMVRLEEEFRHMLVVHSECVDPDWLLDSVSGPSTGEEDVASHSSGEDEDDEDIPVAQPVTDLNFTIDLIPTARIRDLNVIAQRMVTAGYGRVCCQVYRSVRKTVLEQSLYRLGVEKLSIEDVQKMTWETLEVKIRKWIQALKVAVKVILASERELSDRVFTGLNPWQETCFAQLATGSMMELFNFGEAIAISRRTPEKLFKTLDMYEILRDLLPDINVIFSADACLNVRSEANGILARLGEAAIGTFTEFENAIQRDTSKSPVPGGAVHPLTRYVMNYIRFLFDYTDTLKQLLGDRKREVPRLMGVEPFGLSDSGQEDDNGWAYHLSPLAVQIIWLIVLLENNLDGKSKLYKDPAQTYLFLMNNAHYIVQKVKQSELATLLGDNWLRKHSGQVRVYRTNYVRTAWKKVLACLRDEGLSVSGNFSSGASRVALKDRLKSFNSAFEELYRTQSTWVVPDPQLREDLRISIAEKLIPAYRSFIGRFGNYLDTGRHPEKHMKYSPDDLENYLIYLFEGTSGAVAIQRK